LPPEQFLAIKQATQAIQPTAEVLPFKKATKPELVYTRQEAVNDKLTPPPAVVVPMPSNTDTPRTFSEAHRRMREHLELRLASEASVFRSWSARAKAFKVYVSQGEKDALSLR